MNVFLDANVLIQEGRPPGGPLLERIGDLVKAKMVTVLTTDLTMAEVSKKHATNDFELVKEFGRSHTRRTMQKRFNVTLPELSKDDIFKELFEAYSEEVRTMMKGLAAEILPINDVKPSIVFDNYAFGKGFFADEGKRHQFPDAFIFERLKAELEKRQTIVIVSNDKDFVAPIKDIKGFELVASIKALFEKLGLKAEEDPNVERFLRTNQRAVAKAFDREVNNWGLSVSDVQDAEIDEIEVLEVSVEDDITSFGRSTGGSVLVLGSAVLKMKVSYSHPNWDDAIWDGEDKRLVPFEDVSGDTEVETTVEFSLSIDTNRHGHLSRVSDVSFLNHDFQYVDIRPADEYG